MDRNIPKEEILKRKRVKLIKIAAGVVVVAALFYVLAIFLRSGISESDIEIATVDKGTIEVSVSANGKVVPLFEEVITSPVSSKVLEVYKKPGDILKKGDAILRLDLEATQTEFNRIKNEMEMKRC